MKRIDNLKILNVVLSLAPGGLENGVVNIARALDPERFHIDVCCLESAGGFSTRLPESSRVRVLGKGPGFSSAAVWKLAKVIREIRPDVVHSHNLGNLIYAGLATGWGRWRPIVHSEHGQLDSDDLSPRRLRQRRLLYRSCRTVHAVSNGLREHLAELGLPASKIRVLVNGVDTSRFSPGPAVTARQELGLDVRGPVLGIVSRFTPGKRNELVFAAFERLSRIWPHAQLLVVGYGPDHDRLTSLARASRNAGRIRMAGFQEDPRPYYRAMDLLVTPSLIEGMSYVVLEAMSCGVPALTHTACGNAEIIVPGESGFVADLKDEEVLFLELHRVLGNPERLLHAGRQARERILCHFSLSQAARQYERLYTETATNSASHLRTVYES